MQCHCHCATGMCLVANTGWWSYEWCHLRHVRQFHVEPDGKITADWSLGSFKGNSRKFGVPPLDFPGYYTSHLFTNGQVSVL